MCFDTEAICKLSQYLQHHILTYNFKSNLGMQESFEMHIGSRRGTNVFCVIVFLVF